MALTDMNGGLFHDPLAGVYPPPTEDGGDFSAERKPRQGASQVARRKSRISSREHARQLVAADLQALIHAAHKGEVPN